MTTAGKSDPQTGTIQILLLGPLRLLLQVERCSIPFPGDGSQGALWSALVERFPALSASRNAVRLVRNQEFLRPEEVLAPGDEIALVPPVSGGAL